MSVRIDMGRKRIPDKDKKSNVWVRLPNPVILELEKEGKVNEVIAKIVLEYYQNKTKYNKI